MKIAEVDSSKCFLSDYMKGAHCQGDPLIEFANGPAPYIRRK